LKIADGQGEFPPEMNDRRGASATFDTPADAVEGTQPTTRKSAEMPVQKVVTL